MRVDQSEARRIAQTLSAVGIRAIADNQGGWGGQEKSSIWGVRPFPEDGLTGNYETVEQMPERWQRVLAASDALTEVIRQQQEHAAWHHESPGRGACDTCGDFSEAVDAAAEKVTDAVSG